MEDTFVKIYRKLLKWRWADNPNMLALWVRILLEASYAEKEWHNITVKKGQLVTSIAKLSAESGLSNKQVRTCLEHLKETGEIILKGANKYSIITICNYDDYQSNIVESGQTNGEQNGEQEANKGQTKGKQRATSKEYKEYKELKEGKNNNFNQSEIDLSGCDAPQTHQEVVDYEKLISFFNEKTNGCFGMLRSPMGDKRKSHIKARVAKFGKKALFEVIEKAVASDFLRGANNRGFIATFDWIILPSNFEKILSGNYDNRETQNKSRESYSGDKWIGTEFIEKI